MVRTMPGKSKKEKTDNAPLSEKNDSDYFRTLVHDCIAAYEKLPNDGLVLDYCKISDRKLRVMILNDPEYKAETRNIYARQKFEELEDLEHLEDLAAGKDGKDDDHYELRDGKKEKITSVDKDVLNIRLKTAQMKRELRAELSNLPGDNEKDTVNFMFIPITREEFEKLLSVEIHHGTNDADFDALIGVKEEMPTGTAGNVKITGKTKVPDDEPEFDVLENGEIVER